MSDQKLNKDEIFNPEEMVCSIEMGEYVLENPPNELMEKLIGKTLKESEEIIKDFLQPKDKIVIKWAKKIGYNVKDDNR